MWERLFDVSSTSVEDDHRRLKNKSQCLIGSEKISQTRKMFYLLDTPVTDTINTYGNIFRLEFQSRNYNTMNTIINICLFTVIIFHCNIILSLNILTFASFFIILFTGISYEIFHHVIPHPRNLPHSCSHYTTHYDVCTS